MPEPTEINFDRRMIIDWCDNGFSLTTFVQLDDDTWHAKKTVCEEGSETLPGNGPELKALEKLFWAIKDFCGIYNGKHDQYHLNIKINKNKII